MNSKRQKKISDGDGAKFDSQPGLRLNRAAAAAQMELAADARDVRRNRVAIRCRSGTHLSQHSRPRPRTIRVGVDRAFDLRDFALQLRGVAAAAGAHRANRHQLKNAAIRNAAVINSPNSMCSWIDRNKPRLSFFGSFSRVMIRI